MFRSQLDYGIISTGSILQSPAVLPNLHILLNFKKHTFQNFCLHRVRLAGYLPLSAMHCWNQNNTHEASIQSKVLDLLEKVRGVGKDDQIGEISINLKVMGIR